MVMLSESETSQRFFGTIVPQNDIIECVILRSRATKNLSRHVERSETSKRRFFAVAQNDKLLPVMPPNEMRIRHLPYCKKFEDRLSLTPFGSDDL